MVDVATFSAPVTPLVGDKLATGPATAVLDELTARGIIIRGVAEPVVLCAVDWFGIGNAGHDQWRRRLADAAGTTPDRVSVHTVHQHDAPWCDPSAASLLSTRRQGHPFDSGIADDALARVATAVQTSLATARGITRVGVGTATVERVASNRRILGADGRVAAMRWSKPKDEELRSKPEGVIDPLVKLVSLWDEDEPVVVLTFYATHPQTDWGSGAVSADFVGQARDQLRDIIPGAEVVHFNGAGGNIGVGKYNDGSSGARAALVARLADGMQRAWQATVTHPVVEEEIRWSAYPLHLPVAPHLHRQLLRFRIWFPFGKSEDRVAAAVDLAFLERRSQGTPIQLGHLRIGSASILTLPGEPFVEYQIAAQQMHPERLVCVAGYGDYGPRYIGTEIAYAQGGYETSRAASLVAPTAENEIITAMRSLMGRR